MKEKTVGIVFRGLAVGLLITGCLALGLFEKAERWFLNTQFHLRGAQEPTFPIVLITIDEDSFDELHMQWPWPRSLHAQLIDTLHQSHPKAIGLNILFTEPSYLGPSDDQALQESLARAGNVVLASALTLVQGRFVIKESLNPPIGSIRSSAAGYGPVNLKLEEDAFVHQAQLTFPFQQNTIPGFPLLIYQFVNSETPSSLLKRDSPFFINYRGPPGSFESIPYYRVVSREMDPSYFKDKIVLVGATSPTLHDLYSTPFATQGEMPGVEIHANILDTLLSGKPITRVSRVVLGLVCALIGILVVWTTNTLSPLRSLSLIILLSGLYGLGGFFFFTERHFWIDVVPIPLIGLLGFGTTVVENFMRERREKERLAHYFSPAVLNEVVGQRDGNRLMSTRRVITVLFSDIRGFTSLSETLPPEEVGTFLQHYFTTMTDAVFRHGGTVDKYMGDGLMALYNAPLDQPDHARQAVLTALEFQQRLPQLAKQFQKISPSTLTCGVGIHTGEAVVGVMGSEQRFEYTAIGDTINLGSRLESLTKEFNVPILLSEATAQAMAGSVLTRCLGPVAVRGRAKPVRVYTALNSDTRRGPRVAITGNVVFEGNGHRCRGTLINVSLGGLAVGQLEGMVETGDIRPFSITLPSWDHPIRGRGKILWKEGDRLAVRYLNESTEELKPLEDLLRTHRSQGEMPQSKISRKG